MLYYTIVFGQRFLCYIIVKNENNWPLSSEQYNI